MQNQNKWHRLAVQASNKKNDDEEIVVFNPVGGH